MSGMTGEYENAQILIFNNITSYDYANMTYQVTDLVNTTYNELISSSFIRIYQVGHVWCNKSYYVGSGGGWNPDPLFELDDNDQYSKILKITSEYNQVLWITVQIPYNIKPAIYSGHLSIYIFTESNKNMTSWNVTFNLEVWNISIPTTLNSPFQTSFSFDWGNIAPFYNSSIYNMTNLLEKYDNFLTSMRLPPDEIYVTHPRSINIYKYLTNISKYSNLEDVQKRAGDIGNSHGQCTNYNETQINGVISSLKNIINDFNVLNMSLDSVYVYGFDEAKMDCIPGINQLFGAVQNAYGVKLKSMSTLNWNFIYNQTVMPPLDLSLNIWVTEWQFYNSTQGILWVNSSKMYNNYTRNMWLYHNNPNGSYLNMEIEKPLIENRLMFWYAAQFREVSGWLYWCVDDYQACPSDGIPNKQIIERFSNVTSLTNFSPAVYHKCPTEFANGGDYYIYPGIFGPVNSQRLQNVRDGIEDILLLRQIKNNTIMVDFVQQLIPSVIGPYDLDPLHLQNIRQKAANIIQLQ